MTGLPDELTETPEARPVDVLADILSSLRLTGGVVIDAEMRGDYCLESQFTPEDCEAFLNARTPDLIAYHYVRSGRVFAQVDGFPAIEARPWRRLLTSVPRSTIPHSTSESRWYSCRARRFEAIVRTLASSPRAMAQGYRIGARPRSLPGSEACGA